MKAKNSLMVMVLVLAASFANAQELLDILDKEQKDAARFTEATFKFSRISFGHSVQTRKQGTLDAFLSTRFWNLPTERSQSFAADKMSARFALEYGVSDRTLIGVGASSFDGRIDGFIKYKLLRQGVKNHGSPVTISVFQNLSYYAREISRFGYNEEESSRFAFTSQFLVAKKITSNLSLQVAPTFIHRGLRRTTEDPLNVFAVGVGGRYKLGGHVSFVSEYYYVANPVESFDTYGPFSLGVNWELSDVMLQFMLTNAPFMVEDAFITGTRNNFNFKNPNLNFGFNFTYTFHLKNKLKNKN